MRKYNITARSYDELYGEEQERKYSLFINKVEKNIRNRIVLDLACGTGLLMKKLIKHAEYVIGIDISIEMLKLVRRKAIDRDKYSLILADAENIPLKNNIFNAVFAITIIQNLSNLSKALKEIRRVIKSNGIIIISGLKRVINMENVKLAIINSNLKLKKIVEEDKDLILILVKLNN